MKPSKRKVTSTSGCPCCKTTSDNGGKKKKSIERAAMNEGTNTSASPLDVTQILTGSTQPLGLFSSSPQYTSTTTCATVNSSSLQTINLQPIQSASRSNPTSPDLNFPPRCQQPNGLQHVNLLDNDNIDNIDESSDSDSVVSAENLSFDNAVHRHLQDVLPDSEIQNFGSSNGQRTNYCTGRTDHSILNSAVTHLLKSSLAPSTYSSYRNALSRFNRFHSTFYPNTPLFPVLPQQLAQFIAFCHYNQLKASTITSFLSAINYVHRINNYKCPSESFIIKKLLHSVRRNNLPDKRKPFTLDHLLQLTTQVKLKFSDSFNQKLFKAMFLTAFFGLFRVGEISSSKKGKHNVIQRKNVSLIYKHNSLVSIEITLLSFKHSQGHTGTIPFKQQQSKTICPVRALSKYLHVSKHREGQLFQDKNGHSITSSNFRTVLRSCVVSCNLNPLHYTSHSFRIGGATYAYENNMSLQEIQKLGRWKSSAYVKYIRSNPILMG